MKKILVLFCWLLAAYAVYFPVSYFGSSADRMDVRVSHILVNTKEDADRIKSEIENGKPFENAADEYSECPSKAQHGDIGYAQRGRYEKNFENAVFTLKPKTLSEPVESPYGWHIIKVTDIKYFSDSKNFKYNPYKYLDL